MRVADESFDRALPWIVLALLVGFTSFEIALFTYHRAEIPRETEALWSVLFAVAWSWWAHGDRRIRQPGQPFEFDALIFFAWPVAIPYYLYRTHSSRPMPPRAAAWSLYLLPYVVALSCYAISVYAWAGP